MTNDAPLVVAIVLNYARWQETAECVRSLVSCDYPALNILIIDNASPNESEQALRREFPGITVLQTGRNLGYTGGINFGIKAAQHLNPSYLLILNPDTLVEKDFVAHLVNAMERCPSAAAACGTIHYLPKRGAAWYAGGSMVGWRGLAVHKTVPPDKKEIQHLKTDFVTGCLLLIRAGFVPSVGMLDDRFFMYLDDIEYSARMRRMGFDLLYVPQSVIYHKVLREDASIHKLYYSVRNRFLLIDAAFSGVTRIIARIYFAAVIAAKLTMWRLFEPRFYRAARMGLEDYLRGNLGAGRGLSLIGE